MDRENATPDRQQLLRLLQLSSPLLPVGGYSYSEGLEQTIDRGIISDRGTLQAWIECELQTGAIRIETAMVDRAYLAGMTGEIARLRYWNQWLCAARETEELRLQSWQMGGSLVKLALELTPEIADSISAIGNPCNYAIAFGHVAQAWQIEREAAILAYVHTWVANQLSVGIKLIPLGQTAGQQILWQLQPNIDALARTIPTLADRDLYACSWGLSLASMQHETLYSRLFRS
ncbi:urease accessory protein UreF [Chamaesiphon minutus]|uniref:Urease accessory protein UreF n=1 Tax=Chamaesiphon minutus (strain ATCC 27169 / PCC 6605) TaxID=1173020 RepID=K9UMD8_CHAP6|nr:urease accessory protein UreF [Chamaesiphon minutus]AFY95995.1 urease accessory protein UreF [Chamaesiphon minutus PCC 6605]